MVIIKTIRQLMGYLAVLTVLVNPWQITAVLHMTDLPFIYAVNPIGVFYLFCGVFAFYGNEYGLRQWYAFDVLAATLIHGTEKRTISGIAGQYMDSKRRYYYQAKVIDWLAERCGDGPNHCWRVYLWEKNKGYV